MRARLAFLLALVALGLGGCTWEWNSNPHTDLVAAFTASPTSGPAPLVVHFDASPSIGDITDYSWSFGDGQTASGVIVDHTYNDPGTYTVVLTVHDSSGNQDQAQQNIVVSPRRKPIDIQDIGITIVGVIPPWWNPSDYPENYFPEGATLRFRLHWSDNDPNDGITLPEDEIQWQVDRLSPTFYAGYLYGLGNPWIPTQKPFVAGGCAACEIYQYQVTATIHDTAGNAYSVTQVFWIVPACYSHSGCGSGGCTQ